MEKATWWGAESILFLDNRQETKASSLALCKQLNVANKQVILEPDCSPNLAFYETTAQSGTLMEVL